MRHRCAFRKLSRNSDKRARLLRALATNLFTHERITTTLARGKELRRYAEKLITLACRGTEHAQRVISTTLNTTLASQKVMGELAERYAKRPGGYTRVMRAGWRQGYKAPMSIVELIDNPFDTKKMFEKLKGTNKLRVLQYPKPYQSANSDPPLK